MKFLRQLLWDRAGHEELPPYVPDDPDDPDEPDEINPLPLLHLTAADFAAAADLLQVNVATIRAVAEIESAGAGFLADGRPSILYEAHIFGRLTQHRHNNARDTRGVALSARSWNRTLYGRAGVHQHDVRLSGAAALDWEAAHQACSWGLFQILGTNHRIVGHPRIRDFVQAMNQGARPHLDAFVQFIRANKLDGALRRRDWAGFARGYNGPAFAQNSYDRKLAAAYTRWAG